MAASDKPDRVREAGAEREYEPTHAASSIGPPGELY
jgi:hypothetical protein